MGRRLARTERSGHDFWTEQRLGVWRHRRSDVYCGSGEDLEVHYASGAGDCDPGYGMRMRYGRVGGRTHRRIEGIYENSQSWNLLLMVQTHSISKRDSPVLHRPEDLYCGSEEVLGALGPASYTLAVMQYCIAISAPLPERTAAAQAPHPRISPRPC